MSNLKRDIEGVLSKYIPPDNLSGYVTTDCDCYEKAKMVHGAKLESVTCEHQKVNLKDYTPTLENATTQIINLIESVIPEEIDVKSKYETGDDGGINVTVDENNDTLTGENLVHLARLASDEGWNKCIADIKSKLIGKG